MTPDPFPLVGKVFENFYFTGFPKSRERGHLYARLQDGSCYRISGIGLSPCPLPPEAEAFSGEGTDGFRGKIITGVGVGEAGPIFNFDSEPSSLQFSIRTHGRPDPGS